MSEVSEFYTAGAACRVLNMPQYKFFRLVERGQIKRVMPPAGKRAVYPREQVDQLAEQLSQVKIISA